VRYLPQQPGLGFVEDLKFVNCTIELSENLFALVVAVGGELVVLVFYFHRINKDLGVENDSVLLNKYMWTWSFEIGTPGITTGQLADIDL
jgi:hypothetical protein